MFCVSRTAAAVAVLCLSTIGADVCRAADFGQPYRPPPRPSPYRSIDNSPRYAVAPPIWQGLYVGGTLGYGFGTVASDVAVSEIDVGGLVGGLHAGYNWQFGSVVAGVEIDGSLARIDGSRTFSGAIDVDARHSWLSSARLRLGYAWSNVLVYATGGVAFGGLEVAASIPSFSERVSEAQFGYVVGGGVEMKFTDNISGRVEALYHGFGARDFAFSAGATRIDSDVTTVRAGLSWHLN